MARGILPVLLFSRVTGFAAFVLLLFPTHRL